MAKSDQTRAAARQPDHHQADGQKFVDQPFRPDGMPGQRAAMPAGSLPDLMLGPQGDENRDPALPRRPAPMGHPTKPKS